MRPAQNGEMEENDAKTDGRKRLWQTTVRNDTKTTMTRKQHKQLQFYESPRIEMTFCEAWSGICAQSVVTEVTFNQIEAAAQESGGELDFANEKTYGSFNHTWEEVSE